VLLDGLSKYITSVGRVRQAGAETMDWDGAEPENV
jgi:hypothetical protein